MVEVHFWEKIAARLNHRREVQRLVEKMSKNIEINVEKIVKTSEDYYVIKFRGEPLYSC